MLPRSAAGAPPARRGRQKPRADADAPRNDGGRSMFSALPARRLRRRAGGEDRGPADVTVWTEPSGTEPERDAGGEGRREAENRRSQSAEERGRQPCGRSGGRGDC